MAAMLAGALARLEVELAHLRGLAGHASLPEDPVALPAAKYHFVVAVAAATQVCTSVIAEEGLRSWVDAADVFRVLAEQHRLSERLADRLLDAVRLRDALARGGGDDGLLVASLAGWIDDLDRFRAEVASPPGLAIG